MPQLPAGASATRHVVVLATLPSRAVLLLRALESISTQSVKPDRILVVSDDRDFDLRLDGTTIRLEVMRNRRTKGLAGSVNTALDELLRTEPSPEDVLVSFLDDDDWWAPAYLAEVRDSRCAGAEVVAATLVRLDDRTPAGRDVAPPPGLVPSALFRGNPGIQGSNLSASLAVLLRAGCFDEALPSCTDRDLCLRLAALGARYGRAPAGRAFHDTLHAGPRLSDRGSPAKREGLEAFYAKWRRAMSPEDEAAFLARAEELFGWTPAGPRQAIHAAAPRPPPGTGLLRLVVGVAIDGSCSERGTALIADLGRLARHPRVDGLWLVLLENNDPAGFERVVAAAREAELRVLPVTLSEQQELAATRGLGCEDAGAQKPIAVVRTLLQPCVAAAARKIAGAVAWILDDDARLLPDLGVLVDDVVRARDAGHDVVLGRMTGAPPVPHAAALRVQLVDLAHLLAAAAVAAPAAAPPDAATENARWIHGRTDYYYDLARAETDRLETPFLPPGTPPTWRDLLVELGRALPGLLRGQQLFRPLVVPDGDPLIEAAPSCIRGGNTLVFRPELLGKIPNLSPVVGGRRIRRSDMLWASAARHTHGASVVAAPICVIQDRRHDRPGAFDAERLHDDVVGYAFARAHEEALASTQGRSGGVDARRVRKLALERLASLTLSVWRMWGLLQTIRRQIKGAAWWTSEAEAPGLLPALEAVLTALEAEVTPEALRALRALVADSIRDPSLPEFAVGTITDEGRAGADRWLAGARAAGANALVPTIAEEEAEVLGQGQEGVVLRRGAWVLKVFDFWSGAEQVEHHPLLAQLVGSSLHGAIPAVATVARAAGTVVVRTAYEESDEYLGGHGPALYALLAGLLQSGWVHTNLHPSNLRLTRAGALRVVDLGRSLRPTGSPRDVEVMVRRAMIVWRWAGHPALRELLGRAIRETELPEAHGWRTLLGSLLAAPAKSRLDARIATLAAAGEGPVLDYGCGKPGALARAAAPGALTVSDPDESLRPRWATAGGARFVVPDAVEELAAGQGGFPVVVCSLVLCAVDDAEAGRIVARCARVVAAEGTMLVAVCDPASFRVPATPSQSRAPCEGGYDGRFVYRKDIHGGGSRDEHHRPLSAYLRLFAQAGLRVVAMEAVDELDTTRFERVGAFLLFRLERLRPLGTTTSLLIKACAMDAATVGAQVRHLVRALGTPRAFDEVLVAVDSETGPFPRQHCPGDPGLLDRELERLRAEGWIDRVVAGPKGDIELRRLGVSWFGIDAPIASAANGQPVATFLSALEQCAGELVLHVDVDALVARPQPDADLIGEALAALSANAKAVTLSLPARGGAGVATEAGPRGPHRVEVTGGWLLRSRLAALLPLPNGLAGDRWELPWHRALDRKIGPGAPSLRKGSQALWYVTPDNARKPSADEHLLLLDRVEAGCAPAGFEGSTSVLGPPDAWLGPVRPESLVVVVIGRNVGPGRVTRCLDSIGAQAGAPFGIVAIDDASTDGSDAVLARELPVLGWPFTLVRRRQRAGMLANLELAIRSLVANPDSIVVLVDLDDALASATALLHVHAVHEGGADVTVGSMLRTDRPGTTYPVTFAGARGRRGGNVWQHLRSFRKALFDGIDVADLVDVGGVRYDLASDWAYMLPIVELARQPVAIGQPLYLHEPGGPRTAALKEAREETIARIVARAPYPRPQSVAQRAKQLPVLCYHRVLPAGESVRGAEIYRRRGLVVEVGTFERQLRALLRVRRPLDLATYRDALLGARGLPERAVLLTFDDGYRDFQEQALPVLERLGVPSVLFSRAPSRAGVPAWAPLDLLYHLLADAPPAREELRALRTRILALPGSGQAEAVLQLARERGLEVQPGWREALYLGQGELRSLAGRPGVTVGCHGVNHVHRAALDAQERREELARCRDFLGTLGGASPLAFAFPDGDTTGATLLPEAGFELGFGLGVPSGAVTAVTLRRLLVPDDESWPAELDRLWRAE